MSGKSSKWLMGCGIGCGSVILLAVLVVAAGYFLIKNTVDDVRQIEASKERLEESYGLVEDYVPELDGRIPPERIEVFLAIRESLKEKQEGLESRLEKIGKDVDRIEDEDRSIRRILGIVRRGVGAVPEIIEYYSDRNEALLDEGMGIGEYYYLYVVAYYSWLGKNPEDGPRFNLAGDNREWRGRRYDDDDGKRRRYSDDVREERRYRIVQSARRMFLHILRRQLDEMKDGSPMRTNRSWRRALETEIQALEEDRDRLPWQDGLPRTLTSSLESYRERLEESYSALLNPLELLTIEE
ncbi:MAG: hypothetical protein ABIL68_07150 [bacterium]